MVGLPQHGLPIATLLVEMTNELRSNDTVVRRSADSGHHSLALEVRSNSKVIVDASRASGALDVARFCYDRRRRARPARPPVARDQEALQGAPSDRRIKSAERPELRASSTR